MATPLGHTQLGGTTLRAELSTGNTPPTIGTPPPGKGPLQKHLTTRNGAHLIGVETQLGQPGAGPLRGRGSNHDPTTNGGQISNGGNEQPKRQVMAMTTRLHVLLLLSPSISPPLSSPLGNLSHCASA